MTLLFQVFLVLTSLGSVDILLVSLYLISQSRLGKFFRSCCFAEMLGFCPESLENQVNTVKNRVIFTRAALTVKLMQIRLNTDPVSCREMFIRRDSVLNRKNPQTKRLISVVPLIGDHIRHARRPSLGSRLP